MPPARMPTLSADDSLNARRVTCHQPFAGIWVGSSACSPGRSAPFEGAPFEAGVSVAVSVPTEFAARAACTPGSDVATCPLVPGPPARGGRGRNGSTLALCAADWSLRLRNAARPTTAHASAVAPGTPERAGWSSGPEEEVDDGEDVGGRDTGVLRRSGRHERDGLCRRVAVAAGSQPP